MQIFGLTIIRTDDLKDLSNKYDEEYNNRVNAERRERTAKTNLECAGRFIKALQTKAAFIREHSRPVNPTNGRMMKESEWPKLDTAAGNHVAKELGMSKGEFIDYEVKFK